MSRLWVEYLLKSTLIFGAYLLTARLGLALHPVHHFATYIWAPSGIALASIYILGYRYWPAVIGAAFLANYLNGGPIATSVLIGVGNTLEPVTGAYLLHYVGFKAKLTRVKDIVYLVLLAALFSSLISATIGVMSLLASNVISQSTFFNTWSAWWTGDALGVLIISPLLFVWLTLPKNLKINKYRLLEATAVAILFLVASLVAFKGLPGITFKPLATSYVIYPFFLWVGIRFKQEGSVLAIFANAAIGVWGVITTYNQNPQGNIVIEILQLQLFLAFTAISVLIITAIAIEQTSLRKKQLSYTARTAQLIQEKAHLIAIGKAKDEFINLASHQLRTPPTIIKQYVGVLLGDYVGKLSNEQKEMLRTIYDSNERQLKVINDLINVAYIDAGHATLNIEKVNIVKLIEDILRDKSPMFETKKQKTFFYHAVRKQYIFGDKTKIGIVLENLIDNASKYTPQDKKIEVWLESKGNDLEITVHDEGIGISEQNYSKLFKKFSRIKNSSAISAEGTGLGLYWAKKIIDLHGWTIDVNSTVNEGSKFTLNIPTKN